MEKRKNGLCYKFIIVIGSYIAFLVIVSVLIKSINHNKVINVGLEDNKEELLVKLDINNGLSPLSNGWYNSEEVEVTITVNDNIEEDQITEYNIMYGTRPKGSNETPIDLKQLTRKTERIVIKDEGITEVIAYKEEKSGKQTNIQTLDVQIDRTPPSIEKLSYIRLKDNEIKLKAEGVMDNKNGAGVEELIYLTDYNTSSGRVIRTDTCEVNMILPSNSHLVQVIAYDKAGNQALNAEQIEDGQDSSLTNYTVYNNPDTDMRYTYHYWISGDQYLNLTLPIRSKDELMPIFYLSTACCCRSQIYQWTAVGTWPLNNMTRGCYFALPYNHILQNIPEGFDIITSTPANGTPGMNFVFVTWLSDNFYIGQCIYRNARVYAHNFNIQTKWRRARNRAENHFGLLPPIRICGYVLRLTNNLIAIQTRLTQ